MEPQHERADGRRARWEQHKLERRRLILEAAVRVVERQPPGEEFHVHQIAEEAGLPRTAVYRHFSDRADLDRALREFVMGQVMEQLMAQFTLQGTIEEIILRIIETYVTWAAEHPALHRLGDTAAVGMGDPGPLHQFIQQIADQLHMLIELGAGALDVRLSEADTEALDLLVFGLVAQGMGAVRHWLWRPVQRPPAKELSKLLADIVWFQLEGLARARGVELDPKVPLDSLLAERLGGARPAPADES